jgi:hypothetical protein
MIKTHDPKVLTLDCMRIYYSGGRFNVESEVIMPAEMSVRESHDIALALQHKIETLSEVERCFVHVDYAVRDGLEHKVERLLSQKLEKQVAVGFKMLRSTTIIIDQGHSIHDNLTEFEHQSEL